MAFSVLKTAQARPSKKNYIINGGMQISQENGTTAGSGSAFNYYPADQWFVGCTMTTGSISTSQVALPTPGGSTHRIRVTNVSNCNAPAAADYCLIQHRLEGVRIADLLFGSASARAVTLRIGVRGPVGTFPVWIRNGPNTRSYITTITITAGETGTDVYKTITIPGDVTGTWPVDNTFSIGVTIALMAGSSWNTSTLNAWQAGAFLTTASATNFMSLTGATFDLFDVGLYEGTSAPPFQLPDYSRELQDCLRYFQSYIVGPSITLSAGLAFSTTLAITNMNIPAMRAAPSLSVSAASDFTVLGPSFAQQVSAVSLGASSPTNVRIDFTTSGMTPGWGVVAQGNNSNARLRLNSRI